MKTPPPYALSSVDHALRVATMLQLEGALTVTEVAARLGVARSTAHRLLAMLVYRDFAVQDEQRNYHPGPVLELAAHSMSRTSRLRTKALPHLQRLVDAMNESANLAIRTGAMARFIASVECNQSLRVASREGMVFPAYQTSGGLVLLADLNSEEIEAVYASNPADPDEDAPASTRPDLDRLKSELKRIHRSGFAVNHGLSERGVVAIGVPVRAADGSAIAGLSVSIPSVRYDRNRLATLVAILQDVAGGLEAELARRPG